ncbi:hypothetical protein ACHAWF_007507 [Thalassiosira exigua]
MMHDNGPAFARRRRRLPLLTIAAAAAAAVVASASPPPGVGGEVGMGTTILAVRCDGGVVVGADTRTSVSGYVSNRHAAKLTFVLDRRADDFVAVRRREGGDGGDDDRARFSTCAICRSGSAADTQHLASVVRTELASRQLLRGVRGTVTHAAALLRNLLLDDDFSASLVCAGYDHELGRGAIYSISPGGTAMEEPRWAAGGSGSTYVLGHLDATLPKDGLRDDCSLPSEEEATELVCRAIGLAMERDGSSGGFVRMYVIDKHGRRFVTRAPKRGEGYDVVSEGREGSSAASLRNFAPAIRAIEPTSDLSAPLVK